MSQISAEDLNNYIVVYGLNFKNVKDKVARHLSAYWNTIKDCFSYIHTFGTKELKVTPEMILMLHENQ